MSRRPFAVRGRRAPYSQVGDWVVIAEIHPVAKAMYWALEAMTWREHDEQTGAETTRDADPSRTTLAEMFGFTTPQAVDPYLKQLATLGAIDVVANPGYPNSYRVHQTPPDDYEGPQTMGQWHTRRAARKRLAEAAAKATQSADPTPESDPGGCVPQTTSPKRRYAPQTTGGVRSRPQGVWSTDHTKEEASSDPGKNPPTPRGPADNRDQPEQGSAPASGAPASPSQDDNRPRCGHGLLACRECGTNPRASRARAATDTAAAARDCRMCDVDEARWDPDTHLAVTPYVRCDHTTPHRDVMAELDARDRADDEARAAAAAERARQAAGRNSRRPAAPPTCTASGSARSDITSPAH